MLNSNYMESVARQCEFVSKTILEAANSQDQEKTVHLFAVAREETNNLSKSLRHFIIRNQPDYDLNAA